MNFFGKTLGLLLASLALSSCGGGGGGSGGSFNAPQSSTMTLSATTTTLPVNVWGYTPTQYGNPTQAEVTITWRNPDGTLVNGHDIHVAIAPTNYAALSCLVDGSACTDGNALFGSVVIPGINGQATVFVNATTVPGVATFTVSGTDPTTQHTVSASMTFTITSGVGPAPANVALNPQPAGIYLPSSGGLSSSAISATVTDGAGQLVPDPVSGNTGVDNIQFDIIGNAGDAVLATSSVGGPVSGATVTSHTVHGVATVSLQAGENTPQGPVQVRATVDRADNNVTNGIQDPVTSTASIIVSDGKLYSIQITSPVIAPNLPGITINCVTDPCADATGNVTPGAGAIPANPDATLSLVVSAKAQDRQGNPVLPGTQIRFGSVDEPVGAPGSANDNAFLLSGTDGNPQEGGTTFTAPSGHFTTAGGGAGPGDALVVFGKAVEGDSDLENVVTVRTVNSATNLTSATPFNRNDTTGVSVDSGSVLPYLIGRSMHGSVTAQATTDANGVAHATLTYTVGSVGDAVAIWAQGGGSDTVTSGTRQVADAGILTYPGVAPATLIVTPQSISGNSTQNVTACVTDALGIRLRGVEVDFAFNFAGAGSGTVDHVANTGRFASLTGLNGCATGSVTTTGVAGSSTGGDAGTLDISAAGQSASVTITAPAIKTLTVNVAATSATDPVGDYIVGLNSSGFSPPGGQGSSCTAHVATVGTAATQTCTYTFVAGSAVTLGETAPTGSTFVGWTGDCTNGSGSSTTVTMTNDATCTATW